MDVGACTSGHVHSDKSAKPTPVHHNVEKGLAHPTNETSILEVLELHQRVLFPDPSKSTVAGCGPPNMTHNMKKNEAKTIDS